MARFPPLVDTGILRPAETALALELVNEMELLQSVDSRAVDLADPSPDPERSLVAQQELTTIRRLFADDAVAQQIITGLGGGLSAERLRSTYRISKTDYDSARKRMRRRLLREGLTCAPT